MRLERGTQSAVTAAVFNALALFFIVILCISRFCLVGQAGPKDYLIIFALVLSIGFTVTVALRKSAFRSLMFFHLIFTLTETDHGLGRHIYTLSASVLS
jgi:hypothetical protein